MAKERNEELAITRPIIQLKALDIAKDLNTPASEAHRFLVWLCACLLVSSLNKPCSGLSLQLQGKTAVFSALAYVIGLRKKHSYPLDQIGNVVTCVSFLTCQHLSLHKKVEKSVIVKSTGNENYGLFLWYAMKCLFLNVIVGIFFTSIYHSFTYV